jgi:hypothetical protein
MTIFQPADLLDISLSCVNREFPYFMIHGFNGPHEFDRPADLHPTFFGCSDWHSAVHNHWLLVRLQRDFPELARAQDARAVLDDHLAPAKLATELRYFDDPDNSAFSRPYGWCWVLRLHAEATRTAGPRAAAWATNVRLLRDGLADRMREYFGTILQFPIRAGLHGNSAFALTLAIDSARLTGDDTLEKQLIEASRRMFLGDRDCPVALEPDGGDFLSPSITEAGLLATVLPPDELAAWLTEFLPGLESSRLLTPPSFVANASDPGTVHLHGLLLTKVWSFSRIMARLPAGDPRRAPLAQAAWNHWTQAQSALNDRHYHAMHWIPTFVVLAHDEARDAGLDLAQHLA